jgi:hypothetical protein
MRKYMNVWKLGGDDFMEVFRQGALCKWFTPLFCVQAAYTPNQKVTTDYLLTKLIEFFIGTSVCMTSNAIRWRVVGKLSRLISICQVYLKMEQENTVLHRTGTTPCMARNLLQTALPGVTMDHLYAYEVESWLYILLHVFLGYTDIAPPSYPLKAWMDSNWEKVYDKKLLFFSLHEGGFLSYLSKVRCYYFLSTLLKSTCF